MKRRRAALALACALALAAADSWAATAKQKTKEDRDGNTPLILAVYKNDAAQVAALLQKGADPDYTTKKGLCALGEAFRSKRLGPIDALLKGGASPNLTGTAYGPPLRFAIEWDDAALARRLLESGADPNAPTVLAAAYKNDADKVFDKKNAGFDFTRLLLEYGLESLDAKYPGAINFTSIGYPSEKGIPLAFALLVWYKAPAGADPDLIAKVLPLADLGLASDTSSLTALHLAVAFKRRLDVGLLLKAGTGSFIDAQESNGKTALWTAVFNDDFATAKLLLDAGADPTVAGKKGQPIIYARDAGLVKDLLAKGADINAKDAYGFTLLLGAAIGNHVDLVKFLIGEGADRSARIAPGTNLGKVPIGDFDFYDCVRSTKNSAFIAWAETLDEEYRERGAAIARADALLATPWLESLFGSVAAFDARDYKASLASFKKALDGLPVGDPAEDGMFAAAEIVESGLKSANAAGLIEAEAYKRAGFEGKVAAAIARAALAPMMDALPADLSSTLQALARYRKGGASSRDLLAKPAGQAAPVAQAAPVRKALSNADFQPRWDILSLSNDYAVTNFVTMLDGYTALPWTDSKGNNALMDLITRKVYGYGLAYQWKSCSSAARAAIGELLARLMALVDLSARNAEGKNAHELWLESLEGFDRDMDRLNAEVQRLMDRNESAKTTEEKLSLIGQASKLSSASLSVSEFKSGFQKLLDQ